VPASATTGDLPALGPSVTVTRLPLGGTSIVQPAQGAPVAAVELWYRAPSTGFGSKPVPALARLAAQVVAASKPLIGDPLGKVVTDAGGRLAITVYSDSISISAVVPADAARQVVKALTTSFFAPVVTQDGFRFAQRDVEQEALISTFDPQTVVRDAIFSQLFTDGPQHYPALGGPSDVNQISFADVKSFAERAFRSQNATLVISGDVEPTIAGAAVAGRPATGGALDPEPALTPALADIPAPITKDFVEPSGGYGWVGPAITSPREATAMDFIADFLFRSDDGFVTKQAGDRYPDSLLVGQFITLHDPGVMFVACAGQDDDALKSLVDAGFARVQQPLEPAVFASALGAFKYHLLSDLQTPTEMADNFGWYTVEGAPDYAPGANGEHGVYFEAANSLTPEYVASVAQKYLGKAPVIVTLRPAVVRKTQSQ
jgi:predicted Zn-dependent peptidase